MSSAIVLCSPKSAKAEVTYCNKTGKTIFVANGWRAHNKRDMTFQGWYKISNGGCRKLNSSMNPGEWNFFYAEDDNGSELPYFNSASTYWRCLNDSNAFDITHDNSSTGTVKDNRTGTSWNTCQKLGSDYKVEGVRGWKNKWYDHTYYPFSRDTYRYRAYCTITFTNGGYNINQNCGGTKRIKANNPP